MKYWSNVCVEGHCFSRGDSPCGSEIPMTFCLKNGTCPHFAWTDSSERECVTFVPIRLILKDKVSLWAETAREQIKWYLWYRLPRNIKKTQDFFDRIPIATAENNPVVAEMEKEQDKREERFAKWFAKAIKEER